MATFDRKRGVLITEDAARRLSRAVQRINNANRDSPPPHLRVGFDDNENPLRLGKVFGGSGSWEKGTLSDVAVYDQGDPPDETESVPLLIIADVVNKFADIDENAWVMIAQLPTGRWYVIAAECDPEEGSS